MHVEYDGVQIASKYKSEEGTFFSLGVIALHLNGSDDICHL